MAKFSSKGLLSIALVLSLLVSLLVYNYLNTFQQKAARQATAVVAKVEIAPNTLITEEMIEQVQVPDNYLQPGGKVSLASVAGTYSKERIMPREQITERLIIDTKNAGFAGTIPADKRAASISVNDVTGVAGLLKPGDHVDVIVTVDQGNEPTANMVFQNTLVLATNKNVSPSDKGPNAKDDLKVSTVTLALTPDDATLLALAQSKGHVSLALRPYSPANAAVAQVGVKTMDALRGNAPVAYAPAAAAPAAAPVYETRNTRSISVIKGTKVQEVNVD